MAIVDVEVPSGYSYTGWRYANDSVRIVTSILYAVILLLLWCDSAHLLAGSVIFFLNHLSFCYSGCQCWSGEGGEKRSQCHLLLPICELKNNTSLLRHLCMYPSSSPYSVQVPDTHSILIVEFLSRFAIENPQQSPVTLYDYYDPGKHDCVVD